MLWTRFADLRCQLHTSNWLATVAPKICSDGSNGRHGHGSQWEHHGCAGHQRRRYGQQIVNLPFFILCSHFFSNLSFILLANLFLWTEIHVINMRIFSPRLLLKLLQSRLKHTWRIYGWCLRGRRSLMLMDEFLEVIWGCAYFCDVIFVKMFCLKPFSRFVFDFQEFYYLFFLNVQTSWCVESILFLVL